MASPGALAASLKHHCWNPRKSDFFPSFDAEIELDRSFIRPFKPITGKLKLSTSMVIRFHGGIRIQLDANVRLRFPTKVDNRQTINWAVESILQDASEADGGSYIVSPVMEQLMGPEEEDGDQKCVVEPGDYVLPFTLHMPGEHLPAPFKSQLGVLQFIVAAYMGSQYCYVQIAEQLVNFGGFLDLTRLPKALEKIEITSHLHESIFSSKPLATFTLTAEKTGFHPGEQIEFTLAIDNPKGKVIKGVNVSLVRKNSYKAHGATKTTSVEIDAFEGGDGKNSPVSTTGQEIMYMGALTVPKPCIPTYSGKHIYGVNYFIQYEVSISGHPGVGKGSAEVIIGTTKPSAALLVNRLQERRGSSPGMVKEFHSEASDSEADKQKVRPRSHSICVRRTGLHPVCNMGLGVHNNNSNLAPPSASKAQRTLSMMSISEFNDSLN